MIDFGIIREFQVTTVNILQHFNGNSIQHGRMDDQCKQMSKS